MKMLDLFCGRFGWGRAFAERGWEVVGVDLVEPPEIPQGCWFIKADALEVEIILGGLYVGNNRFGPGGFEGFDFICASSPCEQFSCFSMKMFQPNPPYPELGIRLFNYTRALCEESGLPYVMENVRGAEQFVGRSVSHCGPFHLWGNAVPPLLPRGITKSKWFTRPGKPGNICAEALERERETA